MRASLSSARNLRGFSLLETLVATALTGMLVVGVLSIFSSWRSFSSHTDQTSQQEEKGDRALAELRGAVRSAGFIGCSRTPIFAQSTVMARSGLQSDVTPFGVYGLDSGENTGLNSLPERPSIADVTSISDVLVVTTPNKGAVAAQLQRSMQTGSDPLILQQVPGPFFSAGSMAVIFSCEAQTYFVVSAANGTTIEHSATPADEELTNATSTFGRAFEAGAELLPLVTSSYFIGRDSKSGALALMRSNNPGGAAEVLAEAEDLQLEYGIDSNADAVIDEYRTARAVGDWGTVRSVSVLLRLPPKLAKAHSASLDDERSGGRELRSVIAIRNTAELYSE